MSTDTYTAEDVKDRRKSSAATILRWIQDEIINSSEDYVKVLGDNLSLSLARSKLAQAAQSGDKISPDVLLSLDNTRLDNLHMAAMQDPLDPDGRMIAGRHSIVVSKYLTLEHALIDNDLMQYTVPAEAFA
jgi:hypothetical protein